jgi:hypothetical protein
MRWKLVEWLTVKATDLSDLLLSSRHWNYTLKDCSEMPTNSLGYGLYDYLEKTNLSYKPNLIRHDMKHILLNYEMKMPDELKIHAFLIGNKSYNLFDNLRYDSTRNYSRSKKRIQERTKSAMLKGY